MGKQVDGEYAYELHLAAYRRRARLTLQQVGDRLGYHLSAVQKWEKHVVSPTSNDLIRIAELYGVSPGTLFLDPEEIARIRSSATPNVFAQVAGVHPAALLWAGEDPERREHANKLTRCIAILERISPAWAEQWIKLAELSSTVESDG